MRALTVRLGKLALGVEGGTRGHELRHGVHVRREVVQHCDDVTGKGGARGPVLREVSNLKCLD